MWKKSRTGVPSNSESEVCPPSAFSRVKSGAVVPISGLSAASGAEEHAARTSASSKVRRTSLDFIVILFSKFDNIYLIIIEFYIKAQRLRIFSQALCFSLELV
jgi:hypothetical protein